MKRAIATFAAGCFWGVQDYFDQIPGVISTEAGYTGGHLDKPRYEAVCSGATGHAEAVRVVYDPDEVSYDTLLKHFFRMHDPTQLNRQGPDIGDNYRSAVFYATEDERTKAQAMIDALDESGKYKKPIVTSLEPSGQWWPAEDYHQNFTKKTGRGACHVSYAPLS